MLKLKQKLPLTIDVARSAQRDIEYVGIYPRDLLLRLAESVANIESDIEASFSFEQNAEQLVTIRGTAKVKLNLLCQRCGEGFEHWVNVTYCCAPVVDDTDESELPSGYDSITVNELGEVNLLTMVEDELILSLPVAPVHQFEDCSVSSTYRVFGDLPEEDEQPSPFAVLANLKRK